jgi:hypothetical protein
MTKAQRQVQVLKRVVERIDQGEVAAPGWLRERLMGAMLALDPTRSIALRSPSKTLPGGM